jgi:uncharacterized protein (DUF849 family)
MNHDVMITCAITGDDTKVTKSKARGIIEAMGARILSADEARERLRIG